MARPPTLGPSWLVGLLTQWGRRELAEMTGGLGYYRINPMLKDGIPTRARSFEPTGYSTIDFADLERAVAALPKGQCLAVIRYAKPWKAQAIDLEFPIVQRKWLEHLKEGLVALALRLDAEKTYFQVAVL